MNVEDYWLRAQAVGDSTGHVVCRCPRCGERCLVAYRPKSQPWPPCRVCVMPIPEVKLPPTGRPGPVASPMRQPPPRVEPVEDPSRVKFRRPGEPRTPRQLRLAGLVIVDQAATLEVASLHEAPGARAVSAHTRRPAPSLRIPGEASVRPVEPPGVL